MDRTRLASLLHSKGITATKGTVTVDLENDFPNECRFVDTLLASSLKTGRCAKLLRNMMVAYHVGIPLREQGKFYCFDPEAICQTIKVLEGFGEGDFTKGPFQYEKGPLTGLWKKHFFQASFLPHNILMEIEREGVGILFRKLSEHYKRGNYMGKPIDEVDVSLIATAFAEDTIERRAKRRDKGRDGGLTGEHLIYAAMPAGNLYLYASFHGEDEKRIADGVRVALEDFPELADAAPALILSSATD